MLLHASCVLLLHGSCLEAQRGLVLDCHCSQPIYMESDDVLTSLTLNAGHGPPITDALHRFEIDARRRDLRTRKVAIPKSIGSGKDSPAT